VRWVALGVVGLISACGLLTNLDDLGGADSGEAGGDVVDAGVRCDKDSSFGAAQPVGELKDSTGELAARLTADELEIFYTHIDSSGVLRTYSGSRATMADTFGNIHELSGVQGSGANDSYPSVTAEGTTYYVQSDSDAMPGYAIYSASRSNRAAPFANYARVTTLGSNELYHPFVSPDGTSALFMDFSTDAGSGGHMQIEFAAKASGGVFYDAAAIVGGVNDFKNSTHIPVITSDLLTLYFATDRNGMGDDIWMAKRTAPTTDWGTAQIVSELSTAVSEQPSWISPDECVMYLTRVVKEGNNMRQRVHVAVRSP